VKLASHRQPQGSVTIGLLVLWYLTPLRLLKVVGDGPLGRIGANSGAFFEETTWDQYAVQRTGWTRDPTSRVLPLRVHAGSWTGGEETGPRRLKGSGWAGATQATWTSTPRRGLVGDVRLASTHPCRMVETVP